MRSVALLAAVSGALVLTAAACSSSDSPGPNYSSVSTTPTPSDSGTPTDSMSPTGVPSTGPNVSPGEVAPTEPTAARSDTSDGAIAYVSYYIKTLDWVYATSRPDLLTPFYAPSCVTCRDGQSAIEQFVSTGVIKGGRLTIKRIAIVENDGRSGASFAVSTNYAVTAASIVTSTGATATSFPAGDDVTLTEWIAWDSGKWSIVEERYA
jgi:hypothetical protein